MASPGLPETITADVTTGHAADHAVGHDLLNEFDLDSIKAAAEGKVIKRSAGGLWVAGDDAVGGGGFGADMGVRYVHQQGDDLDDGQSPATAKATAQSAVTSLAGDGIVRFSRGTHTITGTIDDGGGCVQFRGAGPQATSLRYSTPFHPMIHLTGRWSGVTDLEVNAASGITNQPGHGGILIQAKNCYVKRVNFWRIGQGLYPLHTDSVNGLEAEDPDAPYCIKAMSPGATEAGYPTITGTELSDWTVIENCYYFDVYRFAVLLGGMNGDISHCFGDAHGGAGIYIERGGAFLNSSGAIIGGHHVNNPDDHSTNVRDAGYNVYLRKLSGSPDQTGWRFNTRTESFSSTAPAHYFCDTQDNAWFGCIAGGAGGSQALIEFGSDGNNAKNVVYPFINTRNLGFVNASAVTFISTQVGP